MFRFKNISAIDPEFCDGLKRDTHAAISGRWKTQVTIIHAFSALRHHEWHGYALALLIYVLAFGIRYAFGEQDNPDIPFITFFPALLLAALAGGTSAGIVVALLSGISGAYFFIPPFGALALSQPRGMLVLLLFALTAGILLLAVHYLNKAFDELILERDRSEALFRELQHRVANNMQFLAALLAMQRRGLDDSAATRALDKARLRIETMGRVHRQLYDPAAVAKPFGEYLEGLCRDVVDASGVKNIVCVAEIPPGVSFDIQRLLFISLIVMETITNSLKHAFKESDKGTISINLQRAAAQFALTISDDGCGFPQPPANGHKGLGLPIIESLAAQLDGTFDFAKGHGTTARLVFPA